jgi:hypothetical protein
MVKELRPPDLNPEKQQVISAEQKQAEIIGQLGVMGYDPDAALAIAQDITSGKPVYNPITRENVNVGTPVVDNALNQPALTTSAPVVNQSNVADNIILEQKQTEIVTKLARMGYDPDAAFTLAQDITSGKPVYNPLKIKDESAASALVALGYTKNDADSLATIMHTYPDIKLALSNYDFDYIRAVQLTENISNYDLNHYQQAISDVPLNQLYLTIANEAIDKQIKLGIINKDQVPLLKIMDVGDKYNSKSMNSSPLDDSTIGAWFGSDNKPLPDNLVIVRYSSTKDADRTGNPNYLQPVIAHELAHAAVEKIIKPLQDSGKYQQAVPYTWQDKPSGQGDAVIVNPDYIRNSQMEYARNEFRSGYMLAKEGYDYGTVARTMASASDGAWSFQNLTKDDVLKAQQLAKNDIGYLGKDYNLVWKPYDIVQWKPYDYADPSIDKNAAFPDNRREYVEVQNYGSLSNIPVGSIALQQWYEKYGINIPAMQPMLLTPAIAQSGSPYVNVKFPDGSSMVIPRGQASHVVTDGVVITDTIDNTKTEQKQAEIIGQLGVMGYDPDAALAIAQDITSGKPVYNPITRENVNVEPSNVPADLNQPVATPTINVITPFVNTVPDDKPYIRMGQDKGGNFISVAADDWKNATDDARKEILNSVGIDTSNNLQYADQNISLDQTEETYIKQNYPDVYNSIQKDGLVAAWRKYADIISVAKVEASLTPEQLTIYKNAGGGQKGIDTVKQVQETELNDWLNKLPTEVKGIYDNGFATSGIEGGIKAVEQYQQNELNTWVSSLSPELNTIYNEGLSKGGVEGGINAVTLARAEAQSKINAYGVPLIEHTGVWSDQYAQPVAINIPKYLKDNNYSQEAQKTLSLVGYNQDTINALVVLKDENPLLYLQKTGDTSVLRNVGYSEETISKMVASLNDIKNNVNTLPIVKPTDDYKSYPVTSDFSIYLADEYGKYVPTDNNNQNPNPNIKTIGWVGNYTTVDKNNQATLHYLRFDSYEDALKYKEMVERANAGFLNRVVKDISGEPLANIDVTPRGVLNVMSYPEVQLAMMATLLPESQIGTMAAESSIFSKTPKPIINLLTSKPVVFGSQAAMGGYNTYQLVTNAKDMDLTQLIQSAGFSVIPFVSAGMSLRAPKIVVPEKVTVNKPELGITQTNIETSVGRVAQTISNIKNVPNFLSSGLENYPEITSVAFKNRVQSDLYSAPKIFTDMPNNVASYLRNNAVVISSYLGRGVENYPEIGSAAFKNKVQNDLYTIPNLPSDVAAYLSKNANIASYLSRGFNNYPEMTSAEFKYKVQTDMYNVPRVLSDIADTPESVAIYIRNNATKISNYLTSGLENYPEMSSAEFKYKVQSDLNKIPQVITDIPDNVATYLKDNSVAISNYIGKGLSDYPEISSAEFKYRVQSDLYGVPKELSDMPYNVASYLKNKSTIISNYLGRGLENYPEMTSAEFKYRVQSDLNKIPNIPEDVRLYIKTHTNAISNYLTSGLENYPEMKTGELQEKLETRLNTIQDRISYGNISSKMIADELRYEIKTADTLRPLKIALDKAVTAEDYYNIRNSELYKNVSAKYQDLIAERIKYYEEGIAALYDTGTKLTNLELKVQENLRNALLSNYIETVSLAKAMLTIQDIEYQVRWAVFEQRWDDYNKLLNNAKESANKLPLELKESTIKLLDKVDEDTRLIRVRQKDSPTPNDLADTSSKIQAEENELDNAQRLREKETNTDKQKVLDDAIQRYKEDIKRQKTEVQVAEKEPTIQVQPFRTYTEEEASKLKPAVRQTTEIVKIAEEPIKLATINVTPIIVVTKRESIEDTAERIGAMTPEQAERLYGEQIQIIDTRLSPLRIQDVQKISQEWLSPSEAVELAQKLADATRQQQEIRQISQAQEQTSLVQETVPETKLLPETQIKQETKLQTINDTMPAQVENVKTITRPIIEIEQKEKAADKQITPRSGAWVWVQGSPNGGAMWKILEPDSEEPITTRKAPVGVYKFPKGGKGDAYRTFQVLGMPPRDRTADIGFTTVTVKKLGGNKISVKFGQNEKANVGERQFTIGEGKGQIPVDLAEDAKAQGISGTELIAKAKAGEDITQYDVPDPYEERVPRYKEPVDKELHKQLLPQYSRKGLRVYTVNGDFIRDKYADESIGDRNGIDFTMGGHSEVYYNIIPKSEIWIEENLNPEDRKAVILHEIKEREIMRTGVEYSEAHNDHANPLEVKGRENPAMLDSMIDEELSDYEPIKVREPKQRAEVAEKKRKQPVMAISSDRTYFGHKILPPQIGGNL